MYPQLSKKNHSDLTESGIIGTIAEIHAFRLGKGLQVPNSRTTHSGHPTHFQAMSRLTGFAVPSLSG